MARTVTPASMKTIDLIVTLCIERGLDRPTDQEFADLSQSGASELIKKIKATPRNTPKVPTAVTVDAVVPDGRYAIAGEDGDLRFYRVTNGTGHWAGRTFVKVMASDAEYPVTKASARTVILQKIAANPREALEAYGKEIGRCGACNRTLTDAKSRARGLGPDCAERLGY